MLNQRKISVAPMMAYTDRHFRVLMRLINRHILLYTEMVVTGSLMHGDSERHLFFSPIERPLALQLGGSNPLELAQCAKMAEKYGYDEVNLNVGCPSGRVHAGEFGACLMKKPQLVAEGISAMKEVVKIPVTVKTRIGVDDHDSYSALQNFVNIVSAAGCQTLIIHARKAWLKGLNPRQNRSVPPLCYEVVYQLKRDFPQLEIIINGGIKTIEEINHHLQQVDGVMIGREAYDNPLFLAENPELKPQEIVVNYLPYLVEQMQKGVSIWSMSRHLMGLFQGQRGAKQWRRWLSGWRSQEPQLEKMREKLSSIFPL